jgi:predicted enzyme related to lactoylglutathione lyase
MNHITGAFGSFAVADIAEAREFYGRTLELTVTDVAPVESGPLWVRARDEAGVFVYAKPKHEPAGFTVLHITVDDLERAIDELAQRGVAMQHLDGIPQDERGIYHGAGHSIAWFADPAGNSVALVRFDPAP